MDGERSGGDRASVNVLVIILLVIAAIVIMYASKWVALRVEDMLPPKNERSAQGGVVGGWVGDTLPAPPAEVRATTGIAPPMEVADATHEGTLTGALLERHANTLVDSINTRTHPDHMVNPLVVGEYEGGFEGGKGKPVPKRPWTEYETWEELSKDRAAFNTYGQDTLDVLVNIPGDWSAVRKASAKMLKDNREWAGLIDVVDGVPTITKKVASPSLVGESSSLAAAAEVPAEVIDPLIRKPAYYFFHTHPDMLVSPQLVSPADVLLAAHTSFLGHYAANIMISSSVIAMYGMYKEPLDRISSSPHPYLEFSQYCLDLYAALVGLRSRRERYSIMDFANTLKEFGMFYFELSTDAYATKYYNTLYSAPRSVTDLDAYDMYLRAVELAQTEAYPDTRRDDAAEAR